MPRPNITPSDIFVLGPPASGKSTVCLEIAARLSCAYSTIDDHVFSMASEGRISRPMQQVEIQQALEMLAKGVKSEPGLVEFSYHDYLSPDVLSAFPNFHSATKLIFIAPLKTCLARNLEREFPVPEAYLERCWAATMGYISFCKQKRGECGDWVLLDTDRLSLSQCVEICHALLRRESSDKLKKLRIFEDPTKPNLGGSLRNSIEWDQLLFDELCSRYKFQSLLDIGCGAGHLLRHCSEKNVRYLGVDGLEPQVAKEDKVHFLQIDLADRTIDLANRFDLVWSVETLEHLPEEFEDNILRTITINCGVACFVTAAPPGQPGFFHVNCKPKSYWIERFADLGFRYVQEFEQFLNGLEGSGEFGRNEFRNNGMLFERRS